MGFEFQCLSFRLKAEATGQFQPRFNFSRVSFQRISIQGLFFRLKAEATGFTPARFNSSSFQLQRVCMPARVQSRKPRARDQGLM
jgi:hypothetical protein